MKPIATVLSAASLLLVAVAATPAMAQSVEPPSDAEIETYAAAAIAVREVADEYRAQADGAESEAEMEALRAEYSEQLAQTVRDEGLSVERYNEIFQAVQNDKALQEEVNSAIMDLRS